jgi:hypothetical protein
MGIRALEVFLPVFLFTSVVAACSGSSGASIPSTGDPNATDTNATTPPPGGGSSGMSSGGQGSGQKPPPGQAPNGPPTITSVTVDKSTLGPGDTVTIDAVVTDPDGPGDITGGALYTASGSVSVAAFVKNGSAYRARVALSQFDAIEHVTLAPGQTVHRSYVVRFDDSAGHSATKAQAFDFDGKDSGICLGAVVASFWRDCASCDTPCPSGTTCMGNACASRVDCFFASYSCDSQCAGGSKCIGGLVVTYPSSDELANALSTCNDATKGSFTFSASACSETTGGNSAVRGCFCK